MEVNFDDLDSGIEGLNAAVGKPSRPLFKGTCDKCLGSGIYKGPSSYGRHCFDCEGKGFRMYKTSPEQRAKGREKAAQKKEAKLAGIASNFEKFKAENPDVVKWWTGSDFAFAVSLRESAEQYGSLTENQLRAAKSCIAKFEAAKVRRVEEQTARLEAAPVVDILKIEEVFNTARGKGLKYPKLRLGRFTLAPASANSRNPGAVYVNLGRDDYLGKIMSGKFFAARGVSTETEAEIVQVAGSPLESAVAYGKLTGNCAVCGRHLENKESVDRGIGPICAEKFGW